MPVQSQSPCRCSACQQARFELRGHDGLSTTLRHGINYHRNVYSTNARRQRQFQIYTLGETAPLQLC